MVNLFGMRLVVSAVISSFLIGFIFIIKKGFKKHLLAQGQYGIWFLLFVILLLPFIPQSLLEIGCLRGWDFPLKAHLFNGEATISGQNIAKEQLVSNNTWMQDFSLSVSRSPIIAYFSIIFMSVWGIGVLGYGLITLAYHRHINHIKQSIKPIQHRTVIKQFNECKQELKIRKKLVLGQSTQVQAPMLLGIQKPYIVLPEYMLEDLSEKELYFIFLHELSHYKKKDVWVNYIICFFQMVYWFNPCLYWAFKNMRVDREVACDRNVLKMLDKTQYIDYGKTIIHCAEKMSEAPFLQMVTSIGGSKEQIKKRIESIVTFKHETRLMKLKSLLVIMMAGSLTWTQVLAVSTMTTDESQYSFQEENVRYEDLSTYFGELDGSFVLYDLKKNEYAIYNKKKSITRVSPNSTYKIYSALFALESGVIKIDDSMRKWNGKAYPYASWNMNQDLNSAIKNSVTWYFQELDQLVGYKKLQSYLEQIQYGNRNLLGGIENFWMESSLKISPIEQVELLKAFYTKQLPFQLQHIDAVKEALVLSEKRDMKLSGKTGTGNINHKETNGWFVGYVEQGNQTYLFATNIQGKEHVNGRLATQITLDILKDKNIYY